jgi:hypothetical protein
MLTNRRRESLRYVERLRVGLAVLVVAVGLTEVGMAMAETSLRE